MQAISCLIEKRDVIALSSTGSGKTYAYLLPMLLCLQEVHRVQDTATTNKTLPTCLIIVPTRELVKQVTDLAEELINITKPNNYIHNNGYQQGYYENNSNRYQNINFNAHQQNFHHPQSMQYPRYEMQPDTYNFSQQNNSYHQRNRFNHQNNNFNQQNNNFNHQNNNFNHQNNNFNQQSNLTHSQQLNNYNQNYQPTSQPNHSPQIIGTQSNNLIHDIFPINNINGNAAYKVVVSITGGCPIKENISQLSHVTQVIVATPGRLIDLCEKNYISLESIKYFVIDECDRLLEMGLEEQLRKIVAMATINNSAPQVSLWSATLPQSLERLARSAVLNPVYICCGIQDSIPSNIIQTVRFAHTYLKPKLLLETLRQIPYPPVLIFTRTKEKADELTKFLLDEQFHVASIHSNKPQSERNDVMKDFISNEFDILVATGLVSRGLDIPILTHVINFDAPDTIEDYIHQCGRTGRFGREGNTTSFLTLECKIAKELKELLESTKNIVPIELNDIKMFGKRVLKTEMGDRVIT